MLESRISQENLQNYIELFADDIKISFIKFEEFENLLINLTLEFKNQKSSIKNTIEELKNVKLYKFDSEEPKIIDKNKTFLENCRNVINKMFTDGDNFDSDMNSKIKSYKINKDNTITRCQENTPICSNKVSLNILQSRQTNKPFIMRAMEREHKYKCRGCNQNIPTKSLFLSHLEEYPSGSNKNITQSYHISLECLRQRGFEISYLRKSKLFSRKMTNKETIDILYEIGFKNENIKIDSIISDSDKESENNDDFPDNVSDTSNISSNRGEGPSDAHSASFTYHRNRQDQKRNIICHGCKSNIDEETYLTYDDKIQSLPVHIKNGCIKEGIFHSDFSRTICKVYKLLRTYDELKELIACGFYINKIIGFRPTDPNVKQPHSKYDQKFRKPTESQANKRSDYSFIFNEESFMLERVLNGEKCQGCNQWIKRDELSLRHKERVPRERMDQFPLISQYYHTDRNCLFDRGFDLKYLSFIKCNAILAGDDNLVKFTEVLLKCGFINENIIYQRSNYQETIEFGIVASFPNMPEKEYKLFVNYCDNSSRCAGCGLMLTPNKKCFIYSSTALQDDNAKVFHFRKPCLEGHFTEDQLVAMTCVNNDIVNVSPQEIINCGIVKIVSGNQLCTPVIKPPTVGAFSPKLTGQKPMSFIVDIVEDDRNSCVVCNNRLYLDSFIIRLTERVTKPLSVHLDPKCVKGMGYSDSELARSKLKFSISSSPALKAKLHDCGFQNMA